MSDDTFNLSSNYRFYTVLDYYFLGRVGLYRTFIFCILHLRNAFFWWRKVFFGFVMHLFGDVAYVW